MVRSRKFLSGISLERSAYLSRAYKRTAEIATFIITRKGGGDRDGAAGRVEREIARVTLRRKEDY